jgi:ribose transport system permease protein
MLLLSNVVSAAIIGGKNENTFTALAAVLGIAIATGLLNGAGVYFLKIPAMIMTLATGTALYGLAFIYCNGAPGGYASEILGNMTNSRILTMFSGVILVWIVLSALIILLLHRTTFGRSLYAIGSNRESAVYAGIHVCGVTLGAYVIASAMAALTGYFLLGYTGTSYMSTGVGYNMDSIAAVVIGGASIMGGSGSYVGTIAGVCIMVLINSLLTILHMDEAVKQIVQGLLIVLLLVTVYGRKDKR